MQSVVLLPGYVQVVFEPCILTCSTLPEIEVAGARPSPGGPEWLALLWRLAGRMVEDARFEGDALVVVLEGARLFLDVSPKEDVPESGVLDFGTGEAMVL